MTKERDEYDDGLFDDGLFDEDAFEDDDYIDDDGSDLDQEAGFDSEDEQARIVAEMPSGAGSLVLTGRGAGRIVMKPSGAGVSRIAQAIPTRDEALEGSRPLLIVHCPNEHRGDIPGVLGHMYADTNGAVSLGAAVNLPLAGRIALTDWLSACAAASIRIADPVGYLVDSDVVSVKSITADQLKRAGYLANDPLDVDEVLDAQRAVDANLLLSPGNALDPAGPQKALDAMFDAGESALASLNHGERLALNITLPSKWLTNPTLRDMLFAELIDQEQFDTWYVRIQWSGKLQTYQQPTDLELLKGYKRLSQLAEDEDRNLILPQTGLTGWLQLGFGARGFGAGTRGPGHAFKEVATGGGRGSGERPRYFEPSLLHAVDQSVHDALSKQPGYVHCDCPYCPILLSGGTWNHRLARYHYLFWLSCLSGQYSTTGRTGQSPITRPPGFRVGVVWSVFS